VKIFVRILITSLVAVCCGLLQAAPADTLILVKDLEEEWLVAQEDYGLVPVLDKKEFEENVIHVPVSTEAFKGTELIVHSSEKISLFIEDKLIESMAGRRRYPMDSLRTIYGDEFILTLYRQQLNPYRISTGIYRKVQDDMILQMQAEQVLIASREPSDLRNVMIFTLVILFAYLAGVYLYYPKVTLEFLKVRRGFSLREVDENLMKSRPLSSVNLLFYIFYSMLGAWVWLMLGQLSGIHLRLQLFQFDEFGDGLLTWGKLTLLSLGIILAKYILVSGFKSMFRIPGFLNNHYYNYIRIGMVLYMVLIIWVMLSVFTFEIISETYYYNLVFILAGLYFLRAGVIYFKLMNSASYSILHLFSYLCGTELMPFMLLIALFKYQPF
jgi:hypothetical protein